MCGCIKHITQYSPAQFASSCGMEHVCGTPSYLNLIMDRNGQRRRTTREKEQKVWQQRRHLMGRVKPVGAPFLLASWLNEYCVFAMQIGSSSKPSLVYVLQAGEHRVGDTCSSHYGCHAVSVVCATGTMQQQSCCSWNAAVTVCIDSGALSVRRTSALYSPFCCRLI